MKNKFLLTLTFSFLFTFVTFAQNLNKSKLDSLFSILAEKDKSMVSVAISKNGSVLYQKAIGFASISDQGNVPATVDTRYRIGSITKMFTAVMIFQLVEEGKLTLATPLAKYFPSVPNADKITIGNLLNHRSGIHNFTSNPGIMQFMVQPKTQEEMVEFISKSPSDFEPDTKTNYSNSNFVLLGYIVEKITGKKYADNLNQRIVSKLQLKNTYYGTKTDLKKNESYSYKQNEKWVQQPETDMSVPAGAGAIVSTPADLNLFITGLFVGKLISTTNLNQMKTIQDGLGMGMIQIPFSTKKGYGHNGGIDGFVSDLYYFQEDDLAVAICSNGTTYPTNDILLALLSSYYNVPFAIPTFKTISLKSEDLDKYVGIYSSTMMPLKITVSKNGSELNAQATGQGAFPLSATETDTFVFNATGIVMVFNPSKNEFILKQGPGNYLFTKEK